MRKNWIIYLSASLLLAACFENLEDPEASLEQRNVLEAHIVARGETKTTLSPTTNGSAKVFWSENDAVSVFMDGGDRAVCFTLTEGAGTSKGLFSGYGTGREYQAFYPAENVVSFNEGILCVMMPEEHQGQAGSFGTNAAAMAAYGTSSTLNFYNLTSLLRLSLTGVHTVTSIDFWPADSSIKVSGLATVCFSEKGIPQLTMSTEGGNHLVQHISGVTLKESEATDFYLPLPPQTYTGGFTVRINTTTGYMEKRYTSDFTMDRAKIHAASTVAIKLDEGLEPSRTLQGKGTKEDPFLIQSLADLLLMQGAVNSVGGLIPETSVEAAVAYYKLMTDIDLSPVCGEVLGKSWIPIGDGNNNMPFKGCFDGGGHIITGLYIDQPDVEYQGLFGRINKYSGILSDLVVDGYVRGRRYVGLLAGSGYCFIQNCTVSGKVVATYPFSGGISGSASVVSGCVNLASVEGSNYTGGIVGSASNKVINCINRGDIYAQGIYVGGVAGNSYGLISGCVNEGVVIQEYGRYSHGNTGGIVGSSSGTYVFDCCNKGSVKGSLYVGGVIGCATGTKSRVYNCLNTGATYSAEGYVGGICGMIEQKGEENVEIRNCINMGVVLSESSGGAGNFTGSICGYNNASIEHCYWLYDPSSGAGMEKGIPFGEGTAQNNFPLSEVQLKGATYGSQLFVMADGTSCTTLLDAMNGWAYDQRQLEENIKESGWKDRLYSGWHYPSTGAWPALTGNPATHP